MEDSQTRTPYHYLCLFSELVPQDSPHQDLGTCEVCSCLRLLQPRLRCCDLLSDWRNRRRTTRSPCNNRPVRYSSMVDATGIAGTTAAARVAQIAVRMASNDWVDDTRFHAIVVDRLWRDPLNGKNCAIRV